MILKYPAKNFLRITDSIPELQPLIDEIESDENKRIERMLENFKK